MKSVCSNEWDLWNHDSNEWFYQLGSDDRILNKWNFKLIFVSTTSKNQDFWCISRHEIHEIAFKIQLSCRDRELMLMKRNYVIWKREKTISKMKTNRHRAIADTMVTSLMDGVGPPNLMSAETAPRDLSGVMEFAHPLGPSWHMERVRHPPADLDPSDWRTGWQHEAASWVEVHHRASVIFPSADERERALLRSQSGPLAGVPFSTVPRSFDTRLEPHLFRVLLLRRLRLPLPPTVHLCRCGRLLDSFGHHRAACAQGGLLARMGFAVEIAAAKVCREAGARVSSNIMVRDVDLPATASIWRQKIGNCGRRLSNLWGHAVGDRHQTRSISMGRRGLHAADLPRIGGSTIQGPIGCPRGWSRRRWSAETAMFLRLIAKAKARTEPPVLCLRAELAWRVLGFDFGMCGCPCSGVVTAWFAWRSRGQRWHSWNTRCDSGVRSQFGCPRLMVVAQLMRCTACVHESVFAWKKKEHSSKKKKKFWINSSVNNWTLELRSKMVDTEVED